MSQNRLKKIALCATAGIVLLLPLVGLFFAVDAVTVNDMSHAVYLAH
jgi:hypothetical protein